MVPTRGEYWFVHPVEENFFFFFIRLKELENTSP